MLQPRFGSIQSQICIQIWILCQRNAKKRRKIKKHKKWKKIKFCIQSPSSFHIPIFQKKSCLVGYLHIVYFNSWTIIFLILESFTLSSWAFLLSIPFIIFLLVFKIQIYWDPSTKFRYTEIQILCLTKIKMTIHTAILEQS